MTPRTNTRSETMDCPTYSGIRTLLDVEDFFEEELLPFDERLAAFPLLFTTATSSVCIIAETEKKLDHGPASKKFTYLFSFNEKN